MKIGILGSGYIGKTLVRTLSAAGHNVKVANSRGPETIEAELLSASVRASTAPDAVKDVDVVILSIPLASIPAIAPLMACVPAETVVIDTSNYYPHRDGRIEAIDAGQIESYWVSEQIGRPVVKAWNAIGSDSFATKGRPEGAPDRIAIPVAADAASDRRTGLALVNDTGFDGHDAGSLFDSWRQQPGAPSYCTDLNLPELADALIAAERQRLPRRRDLGIAALQERGNSAKANPSAEVFVRLNRALFM